MKLKFTINYKTAWGQGLYVAITYCSQDGRERSHLLAMTTDDGECWTLETSVMESRQRPVTSFRYCYQVMDSEGGLLRREWDKVPRRYAFDSSRSYIFPDQWRDVPLAEHLYTEAYHVATSCARHRPVEVVRVPLFRRTILFRVSAPQLRTGESVALCGSHPAIGGWSPSRFLPMNPVGDGEWMLTVNVEGMSLPLEYKYVIVDANHHLATWEEGDNRTIPVNALADGEVLVLHGGALRTREEVWRAAGVAVPVFSLRSEHSFGVGDFGDLRDFVGWAAKVGMHVVQLLPVADTTTMHSWTDSHPYNAISAFALHPHYLDLSQLPPLDDEEKSNAFRRQQRELNALDYSDYMAVDRVKTAYIDAVFALHGAATLATEEVMSFVADNEAWLMPYAAFCLLRDIHNTSRFTDWGDYAQYDEARVRAFLEQNREGYQRICFVQYHLHRQLAAAAHFAHEQGVALMGDLPIGVYRDSVETWRHPEFFDFDAQIGTPPDQESLYGQNWGFPAYRWNDNAVQVPLYDWIRRRLQHIEQYFDALRIDHAVGYFRVWQLPADAVLATMGHFEPALPMSAEEIERWGLTFRRELHTRPFVNDRIIQRLFGIHASYVKEHFLVAQSYGLYALRQDFDTQVKVRDYFGGRTDENSLWIRDGLYRLIANVLFLEDSHLPGMYHPRFLVYQEPVYEILTPEEKDAFMRLYNNYYYERHNAFWAEVASQRLGSILAQTRMLICAEDLGMLPPCVPQVLDSLRILSTEIQGLPKQPGYEFAHLEANPYRSLCTLSTHDMAPLRLWWEENIGRTQRYYATVLQQQGRAPQQLTPLLAERIVARQTFSPSMLCILAVQDWLAMDGELRGQNAADERINAPYDVYNQWKYRMRASIEQLVEAGKFNNKVRTMLAHSRR